MCRIKYSIIASFVTFVIGVALALISASIREAPSIPEVDQPRGALWPVELRKGISPWQVMLSFEKRDLKKLGERDKRALRTAIEAVAGKVDDPEKSPTYYPRLFRQLLNAADEPRYILIEESPQFIIPGSSELRLHVFDTEGRILNTQEFSLWRTLITGVRVSKVRGYRDEVLVIETIGDLGGPTDREFYKLVGNEMRLNNVDKRDH